MKKLLPILLILALVLTLGVGCGKKAPATKTATNAATAAAPGSAPAGQNPGSAQAATPAAPPAPGSLRMKFAKGQVDKYNQSVEMSMTMSGGPAQKMTVSGTMTQTVLDVNPDGSAKIKYEVSEMKANKPGPSMPAREFTATVAPNGKVSGVEVSGAKDKAMPGLDLKDLAEQYSTVLPDGPMTVGRTWTDEKDGPFGGKMVANFKVVGDNVPVGKEKAIKISFTVNYKASMADIAKKRGGDPKGPVPQGGMTVSGSGTTFISAEQGKTLKADVDAKMVTDMQRPAGETQGPTSMHMEVATKTHLQKIN